MVSYIVYFMPKNGTQLIRAICLCVSSRIDRKAVWSWRLLVVVWRSKFVARNKFCVALDLRQNRLSTGPTMITISAYHHQTIKPDGYNFVILRPVWVYSYIPVYATYSQRTITQPDCSRHSIPWPWRNQGSYRYATTPDSNKQGPTLFTPLHIVANIYSLHTVEDVDSPTSRIHRRCRRLRFPNFSYWYVFSTYVPSMLKS